LEVVPQSAQSDSLRGTRSRSVSSGASNTTRPKASGSGSQAEQVGQLEDKRKRNTEASGNFNPHFAEKKRITRYKARFRLKKKERNLNLEQTISELSGRAEELEKEAENLRRENGWLKEIVVMKSRAQREDSSSNQGQQEDAESGEEEEEPRAGRKRK
jgi:hypothetical protein